MKHINNIASQLETKLDSVSATFVTEGSELKSANNSNTPFLASQNNSTLESKSSRLGPLTASGALSLVSEIDLKIQHTNSRIDMLQNNHQQMLNDVTRLLKVIENSKLENRILKETLKEVKQMNQDLHKTLAINQVSILALEERLVNLEKISYDGTLLWRINNVSERIQEAKSGKLCLIFFTVNNKHLRHFYSLKVDKQVFIHHHSTRVEMVTRCA